MIKNDQKLRSRIAWSRTARERAGRDARERVELKKHCGTDEKSPQNTAADTNG